MDLSRWFELTVVGRPDQLDAMLGDLDARLPNGWSRGRDLEDRMKGLGLPTGGARCYRRREEAGRPETSLWLARPDPCTLTGGQVLPLNKSWFGPGEETTLLTEFVGQALEPVTERAGLRIEYKPRPHPVETALAGEALRRLYEFNARARKAGVLSEPGDRDRWQSFIIASHRSSRPVSPDEIEDWLRSHGWRAEQAAELAATFRFAGSLLASYDEAIRNSCP